MTKSTLTWALVDQTAEELGASAEARRKWRNSARAVPSAWRIKITEALAARKVPVALSDFDRLEAAPGRIAA